MLRILKWSYDLGVKQERTRIAAHLQNQAQSARVSNGVFDDMIREELAKPKAKQNRIERLEFQRSVDARVEQIINEMFQPRGDWVPSASYIFPDEVK